MVIGNSCLKEITSTIDAVEKEETNGGVSMKARIRFTDIISHFTYDPIRKGYMCDEDWRSDDKKMLFYPIELVQIQ